MKIKSRPTHSTAKLPSRRQLILSVRMICTKTVEVCDVTNCVFYKET